MKMKRVLPWVLGGMVTVAALGWGANTEIVSAEEHDHKHGQQQMQQEMMQDGKQMMDPKMMQDMMKDPAMHKQCMDMMQQPEMQSMMKEMMQKDGQFHKMMLDLVNSVEIDEPTIPQVAEESVDHKQHL